ncbi:lysophospholipid acyltransferase family protein [Ruminococcus flavefaciens]|uniref:Phospholipid/glycerol acyltransferase domain-containing protein n=1 Tax=Ruminococcus flavefaciens 007c TaxID=1341157 RepID=W7UES0_RUMFL|nr:lysophospholipid acyltransferase family protein [Ruminococcus flavefaciens]EWM53646.1 hypothetical protein RF007C_06190 [Ruminococcus flavefaciens 007c]
MKKENKLIYRGLRLIFKPLFHILFRPVIIGRENIPSDGAAVLAGNHKHAFDPIFVDVCTKRIVCTLAKKELHDGKFGFIFRGAGTIPVDLHSARNPDALDAAVRALKEGEIVNVSPEAKRNNTSELLLPFKFGAAVMSYRTGAPVIPYAISGKYKPFRGRVTIKIGSPVYPAGKDTDTINREIYNSVAELLMKIMPQDELKSKRFSSYDEWRTEYEKTS